MFARCIVTWASKLQTEKLLSTTKADLPALKLRTTNTIIRLIDEMIENSQVSHF